MKNAGPSLFPAQMRGELWKLFGRQRTYIGFGAFLLIELLLLFLLQLPKVQWGLRKHIEEQGFPAELYFSGLTLAFIVVSSTIFLVGPLYLALVAGDVVAKEVEDGTMRMILSRPASRARVVAVRYLAAIFYTWVLVIFIAASAVAVGLAKQGMGGMFIFAPSQKLLALYDFTEGWHRFLISVPLMGLSFMTVTSLGFLFSCCNMKPSAATIVCLSLYFIDMIFQGIPQFHSIEEWFLTTHMFTWINVYRPVVPVYQMVEDYGYLLGANATFFVAGMLIFQGRDFKA